MLSSQLCRILRRHLTIIALLCVMPSFVFVVLQSVVQDKVLVKDYVFYDDRKFRQITEDYNDGNKLSNKAQRIDTDKLAYPKSEKIPLYTVSLEEYAKYFKLFSQQYSVCSSLTRPSPQDINWKKEVYQYFHWTTNYNRSWALDVYFLNMYFDDRFVTTAHARYIRTVVTILGPGHDNAETIRWKVVFTRKKTMNMLLWYEGFTNPVTTGCSVVDAAPLIRDINGQGVFYFQYVISCTVPDIGILPVNASIVCDPCEKPRTYKQIIYPEEPRHPGSRDIGMCMASLYGKLSKYDIPYMVSWFEALRLFGVLEVTMNNATCTLADAEIQTLFQYYQDSGFLKVTHYPVIHDKPWTDEDRATETINKITTTDCFMRKLKKYWFVLIHDIDELIVPSKHKTYVSFLEDYDKKVNNLSLSDCITIRSAFFYMNFETGNPEYPTYLPIHRKTRRWDIEPIETDGVGLSKSFNNMQSLVAAGHHMCRQSNIPWDKLNQWFLPDEDITLHHYRNSTKFTAKFAAQQNMTFRDDTLLKLHGVELRGRAEKVLKEIKYFV